MIGKKAGKDSHTEIGKTRPTIRPTSGALQEAEAEETKPDMGKRAMKSLHRRRTRQRHLSKQGGGRAWKQLLASTDQRRPQTQAPTYSENSNFESIQTIWPLHAYSRYPANRQNLGEAWVTELPHDTSEWENYFGKDIIDSAFATAFLIRLHDLMNPERLNREELKEQGASDESLFSDSFI